MFLYIMECVASDLGSAFRCRYCLRYHRKWCWGRKRATHNDNSCQHWERKRRAERYRNIKHFIWWYRVKCVCAQIWHWPAWGRSCVECGSWSVWSADSTSHSAAPDVLGTPAVHSGPARCGSRWRETPPARWWTADMTTTGQNDNLCVWVNDTTFLPCISLYKST